MQRRVTVANEAARSVEAATGETRRSLVRRIGLATTIGLTVVALASCSGEEPLTTPDGSPISTVTTRVAEVNIVSADRDYAKTCLAPTTPDPGEADVEQLDDGWTVVTADNSLSAQWEHMIAVTRDGFEILTPWPKK